MAIRPSHSFFLFISFPLISVSFRPLENGCLPPVCVCVCSSSVDYTHRQLIRYTHLPHQTLLTQSTLLCSLPPAHQQSCWWHCGRAPLSHLFISFNRNEKTLLLFSAACFVILKTNIVTAGKKRTRGPVSQTDAQLQEKK